MKLAISSRFDADVLDELAQDWDVIDVRRHLEPGKWRLSEDELIAAISDADVLVTEGDEVTGRLLDACPQLKAVVACRGNPVNVDLQAATEKGVLIMNAPGRNAHAVTELCISLMVMVARNGWEAMKALRSGKWADSPRAWAYLTFQGIELAGRTAGLIGLGHIGRLVAERLNAFEMRVLAYDPYVEQEKADSVGVELVSLDELMRESDFVSMHVHVTDETRGMVGHHEFSLMKPTAFFINTGRAGAVDEEAMMEALREERIAGAAFDVYHAEPLPADHPLLKLPNVVATPHIGGATHDVVRHMSQIAQTDLEALQDGVEPPHLFNPEVLESPDLRMEIRAA
jgi:D-3-phosphoglycerate dehydrogenase